MKPKIILIYCIILAQLKVNLKISKLIIKVHSHTVLMKKKKSLQTHLACQLNLKKLVKFTWNAIDIGTKYCREQPNIRQSSLLIALENKVSFP